MKITIIFFEILTFETITFLLKVYIITLITHFKNLLTHDSTSLAYYVTINNMILYMIESNSLCIFKKLWLATLFDLEIRIPIYQLTIITFLDFGFSVN